MQRSGLVAGVLPEVSGAGEVAPRARITQKRCPVGASHHHPRLHICDPPRPQPLQPGHFGLDVVAFDVEMHARRMVDLLDLDRQAGLIAESVT